MTIAAVDQVDSPVKGKVYVNFDSNNPTITLQPRSRELPNKCSNLTVTITKSSADSVELILYAEGPCKSSRKSTARLQIYLQRCTCPIGFQLENCDCVCDPLIRQHISKCNRSRQTHTLLRQTNVWLTYSNESGYIIYPDCPYDYCFPASVNIEINLNIPKGSDVLCAFSLIGLLCSSCKPGLSLSLGSTHCVPCSSTWPITFTVILIGTAVLGILLGALILIFNLTIAFGTLNGLINILASKREAYALLTQSNFYSVFIAWLNFEIGVDTCFYQGMDSYSKVWLLLLYPTYLIAVLALFVIISKYSSRFTNLIANRNPIATLATIIILSYTTYLRNVIDILPAAYVDYPTGPKKLWLPDTNIEYLRGKHIPLFLVDYSSSA